MSAQQVSQSKRHLKRTFIFLEKVMPGVPAGRVKGELQKKGRVAEIIFTRGHSASDIGRLLLATFPSLVGTDLNR